jgi:hypothetical protein
VADLSKPTDMTIDRDVIGGIGENDLSPLAVEQVLISPLVGSRVAAIVPMSNPVNSTSKLRFTRLGYKLPGGKLVTGPRIIKWREKMMTELARENLAVAQYQFALKTVKSNKLDDPIGYLIGIPDEDQLVTATIERSHPAVRLGGTFPRSRSARPYRR